MKTRKKISIDDCELINVNGGTQGKRTPIKPKHGDDLETCPKCGGQKLKFRVCPNCGFRDDDITE